MNKVFCDFCKKEIEFEKDNNKILLQKQTHASQMVICNNITLIPNTLIRVKRDSDTLICLDCIQLLKDTIVKKQKRVRK